jgi:hypothetical protein
MRTERPQSGALGARTAFAAGLALALLLPPALAADGVPARTAGKVTVEVGPNGRRMITDGGGSASPRRFSGKLMPIPDSELEPVITRHADSQQLDPKLVRAMIQVESGYNPSAVSRKGAVGLMQLMPTTASSLAVSNPYDPDENVRGGTAYLRRMIDRFEGRLELAVAAYNAGPGAVERHGGIPPYRETRDYVRRVLALYRGVDRPDLPLRPLAVTGTATGLVRKTRIVQGANARPLLTTALSGSR